MENAFDRASVSMCWCCGVSVVHAFQRSVLSWSRAGEDGRVIAIGVVDALPAPPCEPLPMPPVATMRGPRRRCRGEASVSLAANSTVDASQTHWKPSVKLCVLDPSYSAEIGQLTSPADP